jgi:ankyrin repeat protein
MKWRETPNPLMGGDEPTNTLNYLLGNAVANNHVARAEWLLQHGANADGVYPYSKRPLREEALIHGHTAMSELLVRYGATAAALEGQSAFQAACMQLDRDAAQALIARNPDCLRDASPMLIAARQGRSDVVALLLDLGMNVDVADAIEQRGLHNAVAGDAIEVVKLLVAHGADIDRPTTQAGGGALGFAAHFGRHEIAALLAPLSRDIWELIYLGMAGRVRELLAADRKLANAIHPKAGITPLFCLPDDEDQAVDMTALLLTHGADPTFKNKEGQTAEVAARRRGLIDAADLIAGKEEA